MTCKLCSFKNPKATVTALVIKDNKLLLLKRNEEPFAGQWDLPGGYMQENETPEEAMKRELKEELGVSEIKLTYAKSFPGQAEWEGTQFPILSHCFLADIKEEIKLNKENSEFTFLPLKDLNENEVAFDSNKEIAKFTKEKFTFDLARVEELIKQLDSSATLNENYLYAGILDGFLAKAYEGEKLVGLGWGFARQTMLRRQAVVEDMIVDEACRGKGYGKKLLLEVIKWAEDEGMEMVELTTNPKRIAANELYKSIGFVLHTTNHYLYTVKK